jgi:hypothetical protein
MKYDRVALINNFRILAVSIFLISPINTKAQDSLSGVLNIKCDIERARIYLDDAFVGVNDVFITGIKTGVHKVKITHDDYLTLEKSVSLDAGDTIVLNETLEAGYSIIIKSEPENAEVNINGKYVGITPINWALRNEPYKIEFSKKYYSPKSEIFTPDYQNQIFKVHLNKNAYPVLIETYPKKTKIIAGDAIYNDGDLITLEGGEYKLIIGKENYKTTVVPLLVEDTKDIQSHQFLIEPEKYRGKLMAYIYSMILPGMGSHYLNRGGLDPFIGLAGYGLIYGSISKHNLAVKSYDQYLASTDIDERKQLNNQWQNEKKQSGLMIIGAGAIWLGGIIWTYFTDDEQTRYNKIKTEIKFDNVTNTSSVSLLIPINKNL